MIGTIVDSHHRSQYLKGSPDVEFEGYRVAKGQQRWCLGKHEGLATPKYERGGGADTDQHSKSSSKKLGNVTIRTKGGTKRKGHVGESRKPASQSVKSGV